MLSTLLMTFLLRRLTALKPFGKSHTLSWAYCQFWSDASTLNNADAVNKASYSPSSSNQKGDSVANFPDKLHLSPLFKEARNHHLKDYKIELVDDETWQMTCGLADAWKGDAKVELKTKDFLAGKDDELDDVEVKILEEPDFDAIEDMRVRNDLFYKIDKGSKEYEEYKFEYHGRNSSKKNQKFHEENVNKKADKKTNISPSRVEKDLNNNVVKKQTKENPCCNSSLAAERFHRTENEDLTTNNRMMMMQNTDDGNLAGKKLRTLTFNQLTAAYHHPFCLDIYVSKGSVRASIIHRATSKVVTVAHSISKDLKFDLASTKSRSACAAVGEVLAKRALDDDIHNVVYTPRKGEKIEGKLHLVLKTIIDYGIDVKVKVKQRNLKKRNVSIPKLERN